MGVATSNDFFNNCEAMNFHNVINVNDVVRCARNIEGKASNSASPSDLLLFTFPVDSTYNGEEIEGGFQKIFISNYSDLLVLFFNDLTRNGVVDFNDVETHINALLYEYYVYIEKIRQITEKNVNPHFVKVLGGAQNTSYENMKNFILNHVNPIRLPLLQNNVNLGNGVVADQLKINFVDNFIYMVHNLEDRPSLTKTTNTSALLNDNNYFTNIPGGRIPRPIYNNLLNIIEQVKYSFILTERVFMTPAIQTLEDFMNMPDGESITLGNFLRVLEHTQNNGSNDEIIVVTEFANFLFFQVVSACYALFLSGVNHNDLHTGNILVKKIPRRINEYHIDGVKYRIYTDYTAMLYDFDRSTCSDFMGHYNNEIHYGNPNDLLKNTLNPVKDIVKVFYYYFRRADHILRQEICQDLAIPGQENNVYNFFNTQPDQWLEQRVTENQLNMFFAHPVTILRKLFERFSGANSNHIANHPNIDVYTYICDHDVFNSGVLDSQAQITHFAEDLEERCQDREDLLNQQIENLEFQNDNLRAERDMLSDVRDDLFLQNQNLQQEVNLLRVV
jgi:hypothetical protein